MPLPPQTVAQLLIVNRDASCCTFVDDFCCKADGSANITVTSILLAAAPLPHIFFVSELTSRQCYVWCNKFCGARSKNSVGEGEGGGGGVGGYYMRERL